MFSKKSIIIMFILMLFICKCMVDDSVVSDREVLIYRDLPIDVNIPFNFLWLTDMHYGTEFPVTSPQYAATHNEDIFATIDSINNVYVSDYEPKFIMITGDLVDFLPSYDINYYEETEDDILDTYKVVLEGISLPFYCTLGNHDFYIEFLAMNLDKKDIALEIWNKYFYGMTSYYSFIYSSVKFIILNSYVNREDGYYHESFRYFGIEQTNWLIDELEDAKLLDIPCLLFYHHPVHSDTDIYSTLTDYSDIIIATFCGHTHDFGYSEIGNIPQYTNASVNKNSDNSIMVVQVNPQGRSISFPNAEEHGLTW